MELPQHWSYKRHISFYYIINPNAPHFTAFQKHKNLVFIYLFSFSAIRFSEKQLHELLSFARNSKITAVTATPLNTFRVSWGVVSKKKENKADPNTAGTGRPASTAPRRRRNEEETV